MITLAITPADRDMRMDHHAGKARKKTIKRGLPMLLGALLFWLPVAGGGQTATPGTVRKVKFSVPPEYPELARRLNIKGVARVEATVAPDGRVLSVKELGGNPVLLDPLVRAVKKWKYEPAATESVIEVRFEFSP